MVKVLFGPGAPAALLQPAVYRSIFYPLAFQLMMYVFEVRIMSGNLASCTASGMTHHGIAHPFRAQLSGIAAVRSALQHLLSSCISTYDVCLCGQENY